MHIKERMTDFMLCECCVAVSAVAIVVRRKMEKHCKLLNAIILQRLTSNLLSGALDETYNILSEQRARKTSGKDRRY